MSSYVVGLDLGQAQDPSALAILECIPPPGLNYLEHALGGTRERGTYHITHLERYPLGTKYPAIVEKVIRLLTRPELANTACELVIDATGVGRPVFDLFQQANVSAIGILITGGDTVSREDNMIHVPKRNLASCLQVLVQSRRITLSDTLPLRDTLAREMQNFKVKISTSGHDTYEAWRESTHDDILLATAMAAWYAEQTVAYNDEAILRAFGQ
jgi:hypothetical protein